MITVPSYTAAQVAAAERPLLDAGEPLMARAALALARIAREEGITADRGVLVLAGRGDNGADALLAGGHLAASGYRVDAVLTAGAARQHAIDTAVSQGVRLREPGDVHPGEHSVVIDGILGIGTTGDPVLRGDARTVVSAVLPAVRVGRAHVVAVDLPSGVHPDTGAVSDELVLPATVTATFGAVKAGLAEGRGPEFAGIVVLVDIGLDMTGVPAAGSATVDEIVLAREPSARVPFDERPQHP
ncbi:NAD(P)H-hydrate epimerase [Microbacterium sp. GXF7504]